MSERRLDRDIRSLLGQWRHIAGALLSRRRSVARRLEDVVQDEVEYDLSLQLDAPRGRPTERLRAGVTRFRRTTRPRYSRLFRQLASGQSPHTLFITCSDSRVDPNLITQTHPGELFIVRDVGNLVPPGQVARPSAVGAAIDYAVGVLEVRHVVICGHSGCGAIKALLSSEPIPPRLANLVAWLETMETRSFLQSLPRALDADRVARLNVLAQLDNLKTYPIVAERLASADLSASAWFFDIQDGEIEEWSDVAQSFVSVAPIAASDEALLPTTRH